jgi:hypothetical protein
MVMRPSGSGSALVEPAPCASSVRARCRAGSGAALSPPSGLQVYQGGVDQQPGRLLERPVARLLYPNGRHSAAQHLPSRSRAGAGAGPGPAGGPTSRSAPQSRHQRIPLCGRVDLEVNTPVNARQHRERSMATTITTTTKPRSPRSPRSKLDSSANISAPSSNLGRQSLRPTRARRLILRSPLVGVLNQGPRAKGRGGLPWPSALGPFACKRLVVVKLDSCASIRRRQAI